MRSNRVLSASGLLVTLVACAPTENQQRAEFADGAPEETTEASPTTGLEEEPQEIEETDDDEEKEDDSEEPETDPAEPVVVERTVWDFTEGQEIDIEVTVHPFMRDSFEAEELISGQITYEVVSSEGEYALDHYGTAPAEVRLFDPEDPDLVSYPLLIQEADSAPEHAAAVESAEASAGDDPMRWLGIYADPGTDRTAVLLPYIGLVPDVRIVDRDEVSPQDYITLSQASDPLEIVSTSEFTVDTYYELADGDVNIRTDEDQAVITLDAEILFDSSQYTIRDDASESIESAVTELEQATGGELTIAGHTDNIDTEEFNQTLSENRAEAVEERLDEAMDLSTFDNIAIEGHSLRKPIATNETEAGRQMNRRVELTFTPPEPDDQELPEAESGDLPAAQGPEAHGNEAITVTAGDGRASEVQIQSLQRVGEVLVGTVSVAVVESSEDGSDTGSLAWPISFGETGIRQEHVHEFNPGTQADALTLLAGDQRIFPLEHTIWSESEYDPESEDAAEHPWHMPLADRGFGYGGDASEGTRATATVIWPDISGDSVTIDVPGETEHSHRPYAEPLRFIDVPIEASY